jgi:5-methylcytosine-specific restriction endonuclease McrA
MPKRRSLSSSGLVALFAAHGGICHLCEAKIQVGEAWERSHPIPLELGGADDESNWRLAHKRCHRAHTSTVDIPNIARAKRRFAKHIGARKRSTMAGSRSSKFKRRMDGTVELR